MHTKSAKSDAQMAESVDALVSNTSRFTPVPVRPRLWVHEERSESFSLFCWFWREPTFGRCVRCGMALYEQARQATPQPPQANAYALAIKHSRCTHLNTGSVQKYRWGTRNGACEKRRCFGVAPQLFIISYYLFNFLMQPSLLICKILLSLSLDTKSIIQNYNYEAFIFYFLHLCYAPYLLRE